MAVRPGEVYIASGRTRTRSILRSPATSRTPIHMPFPSSLPHTANNLPGEIDLNGKIYASVVDPSPWSEPLYILSHSALLGTSPFSLYHLCCGAQHSSSDIMYNHKIPPALEKSFPDFNPSPSFHAATINTLGRHQLPPASRNTAFDDTTMPFASGAAQQVATLFHDPSVAFPFVVPDNDYFPLTTDQLTAGKGPDQRHAHDPSLVPTFPPGESLETTSKSPLTAFPSCETENRRSLSALNQNGRTKPREAQSSRHRGGAVSPSDTTWSANNALTAS